ncbi:MAG: SDR family NAD(P)-dependent oxidoreductase, partial [Dongiaceae bacterium]
MNVALVTSGRPELSGRLGRWNGHADHRCSSDEFAANGARGTLGGPPIYICRMTQSSGLEFGRNREISWWRHGMIASESGPPKEAMPMQPLPETPPTVHAMNVTLVTGASSGLGRAIALRLAARGERIIAVARRREPLDALIRDIEAAGGCARAISCDVTDREQVLRAVAEVESTDGPIERLVSCTGGGKRTTVAAFQAAQLEQMLSLNVMGTANCLEAVLPRMLHRRRGHIVAISSLAAARGLPGSAEHSAAKAALSTLLEGLRIDLNRHGIDLTVLSPGFV